jgi:hypothetical protein
MREESMREESMSLARENAPDFGTVAALKCFLLTNF